MKRMNLYNFLFIAALTIACASCSLDLDSEMSYKEDEFWQTEADFDAALTGCYNALYEKYLFGGDATPLFFETITPNAFNYNNSHGFSVIAEGTQTPSNSSIINGRWRACYELIGRCNTLIDRIHPFHLDEKKKRRMVSEALFLRALGYFILTDHYGDVPLILETPDEMKHGTLPRTPKQDVVQQVITDLDSATHGLPADYSEGDIGHVTWGAAKTLLCRVYLYNQLWKEAEEAADEIIGSGIYSLFPNYRGLFLEANENNREVIFDIRFDQNGVCHSADVILQLYTTSAPLLNLIEAYQMSNGSNYDESKPLYEHRDPRFYATIVYPGAQFLGKRVQNNTFMITGYCFKKYTRYDAEAQPLVLSHNRSDINYIYLRYADVLLSYAEARNERLDAPDIKVFQALNQVRERPGVDMPAYNPGSGYNREAMRKLIRQERRIEFAGEGLYYSDIIRWQTADSVMNQDIKRYDGIKIMRRYFEQKSYLWPIPDREIRSNTHLLPNNQGY